MIIQLLKDQCVCSKNRFCKFRYAVCVCVCVYSGGDETAHSPLFHPLSPDPLADLLVPPAASLYSVFEIYWRVNKEPESQCKHTGWVNTEEHTIRMKTPVFLCLSLIYPDEKRKCWQKMFRLHASNTGAVNHVLMFVVFSFDSNRVTFHYFTKTDVQKTCCSITSPENSHTYPSVLFPHLLL